MNNNKCPLCSRKMIKGASLDEHHLIPKSFKGKKKVLMHKICHRKIHSVFSERELLKYYNTIERILENEEVQKFVKWVKNKDPEFYDNHKDTKQRKKRRRR